MTGDPFATLTQANILQAFHHASALQTEGRWDEATALWTRIAQAAPQSAEARFNLGVALFEQHRFAEAEGAFRRAAAMRPSSAWAHHRLGNLLHATGRWREAEPCYRAALDLEPQSQRYHLDLGHLYLGFGDYPRGWPLFEARKGLPGQNADPLPLPNEWQGEPLAGKRLLVWPEQGFGDQIMFARFIPELVRRGAEVTLVAPAELVALFSGLGATVLKFERELQVPQPDYWTLLMSVPYRLGVTLESLPASPYLTAPPSDVGAARIGVMATGSPHHPNDRERSLPPDEAARLLALPGAMSLNPMDTGASDFAQTAGLIAALDLVITVDTATAHLAGALGKPCWILLPWLRSDWRWLQDREDSPWYPSARLFRQMPGGDWSEVVARLAKALA